MAPPRDAFPAGPWIDPGLVDIMDGEVAVAGAGFRVAGPVCDNGDTFHDVDGEGSLKRLLAAAPELEPHADTLASALVRLPARRLLPAETAVGDLVAFLDTGAYSYDLMTQTNGHPRPEVILVDGDTTTVLRRRDTEEDLWAGERLLPR